jgi:hypothetical protein
MRFPVILLASVLLSGVLFAQPTNEDFAKGLKAYTAGDVATAKSFLTQALKADPKNKQAALLLQRIQTQERVGGNLEARAAKVIIPEVNFKDASLTTVLDYLPVAATEHSNGQFSLNVVRMFSSEYGAETKITLALRQVPLSELIRYVAQLGGLTTQFQPHAVVLSRPQSTDKQADAAP